LPASAVAPPPEQLQPTAKTISATTADLAMRMRGCLTALTPTSGRRCPSRTVAVLIERLERQ
jgi:hypothetical protein